ARGHRLDGPGLDQVVGRDAEQDLPREGRLQQHGRGVAGLVERLVRYDLETVRRVAGARLGPPAGIEAVAGGGSGSGVIDLQPVIAPIDLEGEPARLAGLEVELAGGDRRLVAGDDAIVPVRILVEPLIVPVLR